MLGNFEVQYVGVIETLLSETCYLVFVVPCYGNIALSLVSISEGLTSIEEIKYSCTFFKYIVISAQTASILEIPNFIKLMLSINFLS